MSGTADCHTCSVCQQIVIDLSNKSYPQRYVLGTLENLRIEEGNGGCELIRQYSDYSTSSSPRGIELNVGRYRDRRFPPFAHIGDVGRFEDLEDEDVAVISRIYTTKGDPAAKALPLHPPGLDIGSKRAFKVARKWLRSCFYQHTMCPGPHRIRLPTRVIDVSSDPPRLVVTKNEGLTYGRYAALSYCWGGPQVVCTTKETISMHTDSITLNNLPKTLRDAVTTTRGLRLKYLWVDALCIIQDDEADRMRELPCMAQIYNNAYVTISASTATSCHDGFLEPRRLKYKPIRLPAKCPNGKAGSVLLMHDISELRDEPDPIHTRGWTLQEHLLAPRLLMFGPLRMQFSCIARTRHDGGSPIAFGAQQSVFPDIGKSTLFAVKYGGFVSAGRTNKVRLQGLLYRTGLMRLALKMTNETPLLTQMLVQHWADIVTAYTARTLGVLNDRLAAISGIASKLHRPELGDYLAGLYSTYLHVQLLWRRSDQQLLLPRPKEYRAPSWSWAAVDGVISLSINPDDIDRFGASIAVPSILESSIMSASDTDAYSRFTSGTLRVLGYRVYCYKKLERKATGG
ncbi:hypothetical protein DL770_007129 [Monosporascus sp. CRB-9-2]|nr:hypothetical protein DL770_007129 [Monosporascus sp. CRB-9-2]